MLAQDPFRVIHAFDESVRIERAGVTLLAYCYRPNVAQRESPKPFAHPLATPVGDVVSLDRPHDHVWHRGLYFGWPDVNGVNLWGGRTFVRGQGYVEKGDHGTMRHDAWDEIEAKPDGVRLVERLAWTKVDGTALACERRTIIVHPVTNERELLVSVGTEVTPAPGVGALRFRSPLINGRPDAGYGGLTLRLPRAMTGGAIRTSTGVTGADAMGERADWLRYTGKLDGSGSPCGVAVFDHPANPRHPTHFFVRNAPFGVINPALCWDEEYVLEEGHDLSLRYGVWIHSGVAEDDRVSEVHSGWVAAT